MSGQVLIPHYLTPTCNRYTSSVQKTLRNLFGVELENFDRSRMVQRLADDENLFFSILLTGSIYGEFIVGLRQCDAGKILKIGTRATDEDYQLHRSEVVESFKEIINIASGSALDLLKNKFPDIVITPPKVIEGYLDLSDFEIHKDQLSNADGKISCYIYIDKMRLNVAESLEREENLIRVKSDFLSFVINEIAPPIKNIVSLIGGLKNSILSNVQTAQVEYIFKTGELLLSNFSEIQEYLNIESKKMEFSSEKIVTKIFFEELLHLLEASQGVLSVDVSGRIEDEFGDTFNGYSELLRKSIFHIVKNSLRVIPHAKVNVNFKASHDNWIEIQIIDETKEISQSDLNLMSEALGRACRKSQLSYSSPLEFSVSESSIEAMNGNIVLRSGQLMGTILDFRILLK